MCCNCGARRLTTWHIRKARLAGRLQCSSSRVHVLESTGHSTLSASVRGPEQTRVLPISEKSLDYGRSVLSGLVKAGVRATLDDSNDRVQAKIKVASEFKIPYLLVVGPNDERRREVSVRSRGIRRNLGSLPMDSFVSAIRQETATRGRTTVVEEHFQPAGSGAASD